MSIHLNALPVELGAHIGLFLDCRRHNYKMASLMALRCVSRACLDAARRTIKSRPQISVDLSYMRARQIKAFGKVFGNGCQNLHYRGDYDTTITRIESSLFIPANVEQPEGGVAQALTFYLRRRHILQDLEVESFTFNPETGELSYVVKIVNYTRWSRSESLENRMEEALDWVISWGLFHINVTHGTPRATTEDTAKRESPRVLEALRQFVVETTGGCLSKLRICGSLISTQLLLEICRACPQLKEIELGVLWPVPNVARADVDDFAAALSRACPLLESVEIRRDDLLSPAETYAMYFPNLKFLNFEVLKADLGYEPSEFGRIEAAARQCVGAATLGLSRCAVSAALAGRLVRTLRSSITRLYLGDAIISQPTLLQLAAGLEALREIVFPNEFSGSPEFFTSLARARPSLAELDFGEESTFDDACVAAMCENLKLEALTINDNDTLTPAVVDIILQSPTAESLSAASFHCTAGFTSAGILRLVRGCPRLAKATWFATGLTPLAAAWPEGTLHGKNVDDLNVLLKDRYRSHGDLNPFRTFGPWPLSEVRWRYGPHSAYPNE